MAETTNGTNYRDINRQNMIAYFEKGDKYTRSLGFELEHIILRAGTGERVSYSEPGGIRDVLVKLSEKYDKVLYDGDDIIGCESPKFRSGRACRYSRSSEFTSASAANSIPFLRNSGS